MGISAAVRLLWTTTYSNALAICAFQHSCDAPLRPEADGHQPSPIALCTRNNARHLGGIHSVNMTSTLVTECLAAHATPNPKGISSFGIMNPLVPMSQHSKGNSWQSSAAVMHHL